MQPYHYGDDYLLERANLLSQICKSLICTAKSLECLASEIQAALDVNIHGNPTVTVIHHYHDLPTQ